jgi:dTDP-4-amino-4,6-dideoxygalactose transaminase
MSHEKIYVTKPYLPPLEELLPSLQKIWSSRELTNGAAYHQAFEKALAEYLGVPYVSLFSNATTALVTALQCLRITGEVITTPFSFVATAHSLLWNGVEPVFVDIEPCTFTVDPEKVEAAITPNTTAIMPVHVYGLPADVESLKSIADRYGLKLIYDAAHAFGASYLGRALADYGDLSVLSFHATKIFNTFEGGAIISRDEQTKKRIDFLKNFGFADETTVVAAGINGKMNEFQAALGLIQLSHVDDCILKRKVIAEAYDRAFSEVKGIKILGQIENHIPNWSYYPIFIDDDFALGRDELYNKLKENDIYARRYFYPLISEFPMYRNKASAARGALPLAHQIADSVLCLPIYPELESSEQQRVIEIITK